MEEIINKILDKPELWILSLAILATSATGMFQILHKLVLAWRNGRGKSNNDDDCDDKVEVIQTQVIKDLSSGINTMADSAARVGGAVAEIQATQVRMQSEMARIAENNRESANTIKESATVNKSTAELVAVISATLQSVEKTFNTRSDRLESAVNETNEMVKTMNDKSDESKAILAQILATSQETMRAVGEIKVNAEGGVKLAPEVMEMLSQIVKNQETILAAIRSQEETQEANPAQDAPKAAKEAANHD